MALKIKSNSHMDHGLDDRHVNWLLALFRERNEFFIETLEMPDFLESVICGIRGPNVGDPPVPESEVKYMVRPNRRCASRVLCTPTQPRYVRQLTVIAGPSGVDPCVLYTAYGGPKAPREPGDQYIETMEEIVEARRFWRNHALVP